MESEQLRPQLVQAQKALQLALDEACSHDLDEVDTGELIRIEETLVLASKAAKEAVSVRLKLRSQRGHAKTPKVQASADVAPITHRVFDDIRGKRWHVFAVHASTATFEHARLPEAYRKGWLLFEAGDELRRVAPIPERWQELSIDDLRLLVYQAASVPRRMPQKPENPDPPIKS
jgi:hypothetical protein